MKKDEIIFFLQNAPSPENLKDVVGQSAQMATASEKFEIRSKDEAGGSDLPAHHYFRGFSLRAKNPNGVARNMPGLLASTENFGSHRGFLGLTIIKLDGGRQISLWMSSEQEIVGCMIGIEGGGDPAPNSSLMS